VQLDGGENVLINGCSFDERSVGSGVKRFSITSNVFAKMEHLALVDKSAREAKKIIAQNLAG